MNIETILDARLWQFIQNSYENRNFTGAILDALHFLSNLIREKTGLESDGVALAGKAFGGKSPKLKVNKLVSDSDRNIQAGVEQLIRGIYQSIRNPRSHEKYTDSEQDAWAIIIFINYLIKTIDQSKSPFTKSVFIKRVFDPDFVRSKRYAELLVDEIPVKQRLEIFIDVYRQKEKGDGFNLLYFIDSLIKRLKRDEKSQVYQLVSEELKNTNNNTTIRSIIQIFPFSYWPQFEESARLRTENKLINSIKDGRFNQMEKTYLGGHFGSWACRICKHFTLKDQLINTLLMKLESSDNYEQDYVLRFFFRHFPELMSSPTPRMKEVISKGLKDGDLRFYDELGTLFLDCSESWNTAFSELYNNFVECEPEPTTEDDIPF